MTEFNELYPVRACEFEMNDDVVTVLFKKPKQSFIEKIFFKKLADKPYKIDLDKIGTFVWLNCDGKNKVKEIVDNVENEFGDEVQPAEDRVHKFIKEMNRTKLVNLYQKS